MWKKLENDNGYPFYLNEATKEKQWDHPKFCDLTAEIFHHNYVKYSKYRLALKFRSLQRGLKMNDVPLKMISGILVKHRLGTNESSVCLDSYDLEAILNDVYFAARKLNENDLDVDCAVELMQNFLYNVFDRERMTKIQVLSVKLVLGLLCNWELDEFYNFLFTLCADHNNCMTRLRFRSILLKLTEIYLFLHEDVSFGQHLINSTVENCFSNSPGLVGITEYNFVSWLDGAPQLLTWIPTLHRLRTSEFVVHNTKCSSCKTSPLIGLRYCCLKCQNYTQCQRCFLVGAMNETHKLSHSMKEYDTDVVVHRSFNLLKRLRKLNFCTKNREEKPQDNFQPRFNNDKYCLTDCVSDDLDKQSYDNHLETISKRLQIIVRDLRNVLASNHMDESCIRKYLLEQHVKQINEQISHLKDLKSSLPNGSAGATSIPKVQSTPMICCNQESTQNELAILSPIFKASSTNLFDCKSTTNLFGDMSLPYSVNHVGSWIKDEPLNDICPQVGREEMKSRDFHHDLDTALDKLQQILSQNTPLDDSLGNAENMNLKYATCKVEDVLASFIDNVEANKTAQK